MKTSLALAVAAVLLLGAGVTQAGDITVPNYSFDVQTGSDGVVAYNPTSWTVAGYNSRWIRNPVNAEFVGSTDPNTLATAGGEGYNCLVLTTSASGTSTATPSSALGTATAGNEYELTVALGNDPYEGMASGCQYTIAILIDGAVAASTNVDGTTITSQYFEDSSVSYTAVAADDGKDITVRLSFYNGHTNTVWACWDNVRLTETSSAIPGDADLDGDVDATDLQTLATNFGTGDEWSEGDFDGDNDVDVDDLIILRDNFGSTQ